MVLSIIRHPLLRMYQTKVGDYNIRKQQQLISRSLLHKFIVNICLIKPMVKIEYIQETLEINSVKIIIYNANLIYMGIHMCLSKSSP